MFRKPEIPTALRTVHAVALSILASSASGEEFSWQLSGGYGETELGPFVETELALLADTEQTLLDATYYIDPVDDSRGPYALAPFLNRSGRVTAGVTNEKTTIAIPVLTPGPPPPGSPTTMNVTQETTGYFVSGRYVWSASGWYVGAAYRNLDTDQEPISPVVARHDTTTDGYQLFGGRYFGESTSLDLATGATQQTTELSVACITPLCLSGSTATQFDTDDWSIGALHVRRGSRLSYSIAGRVSGTHVTASFPPLVLTLPSGALPPASTIPPIGGIAPPPLTLVSSPSPGALPMPHERETYSISGELFPTDRLGLRIGAARSDGDYAEDESYDVAATWFFTRAAAVQFVLARTENEYGAFSRDIDSAEIRFFGRL